MEQKQIIIGVLVALIVIVAIVVPVVVVNGNQEEQNSPTGQTPSDIDAKASTLSVFLAAKPGFHLSLNDDKALAGLELYVPNDNLTNLVLKSKISEKDCSESAACNKVKTTIAKFEFYDVPFAGQSYFAKETNQFCLKDNFEADKKLGELASPSLTKVGDSATVTQDITEFTTLVAFNGAGEAIACGMVISSKTNYETLEKKNDEATQLETLIVRKDGNSEFLLNSASAFKIFKDDTCQGTDANASQNITQNTNQWHKFTAEFKALEFGGNCVKIADSFAKNEDTKVTWGTESKGVKVSFDQASPVHPTLMTIDFNEAKMNEFKKDQNSGVTACTKLDSVITSHNKFHVHVTKTDICSDPANEIVGGHHAPISKKQVNKFSHFDQEIGDLSTKHGGLNGETTKTIKEYDFELPLFGIGEISILGRSVVIHEGSSSNARSIAVSLEG